VRNLWLKRGRQGRRIGPTLNKREYRRTSRKEKVRRSRGYNRTGGKNESSVTENFAGQTPEVLSISRSSGEGDKKGRGRDIFIFREKGICGLI